MEADILPFPEREGTGRWRIRILVRDDCGRAAWQDALAAEIPERALAERVLGVLSKRRPGKQYRLREVMREVEG